MLLATSRASHTTLSQAVETLKGVKKLENDTRNLSVMTSCNQIRGLTDQMAKRGMPTELSAWMVQKVTRFWKFEFRMCGAR